MIDFSEPGHILKDPERLEELRDEIIRGSVVVGRSVINSDLVTNLVDYLKRVGRNSLPTYAPIEIGQPNFHRLNMSDERSYVEGCFHQFVFYPWNQDVFDLFSQTRDLFCLKSALSGMPPDLYLGREGNEGVVARLAIQFYPKGLGYLNRHRDPVGSHQLTVPTVTLSTKGVDFESGGLFVEGLDGDRCEIDDITGPGDAVFVDARLTHGVDRIDPDAEVDWLSFQGRWSMLIATNKVASNEAVPNAVDLGDAS